MKVAVVFDNRTRPETTGYYCRRALGKLVDVEHLLPEELPLIDPSIFDLFVLIDDGLEYEIPETCRPRAAWAIDTHMNLERCARRFGNAETVFAAQKNGAVDLAQCLGRPVHWLPLACDPELHRPVSGEKKHYDLGFVGYVVGERRQELLDRLIQRYPQSWTGQAFFDEMARKYSQARVGFNCSVADDLNMRLFEIPACGLPLVTNHISGNGLEELFELDRHILTYRDTEELYEHIDRLLSDQRLADRLARETLAHVRSRHTYSIRMEQLLTIASRQRSTVVKSEKSYDYFEFDRPDVRSLVPSSCHRILDLGCGGGRMGHVLKSERNCSVVGVEANHDAAGRARQRLDDVVCESLETMSDSLFPESSFDCIVLADVLEHLRQPLPVLKMCRHWLVDTGSLIISIPNSRHHSVVAGLIEGNWTYEPAGLLDDDHVRIFTRRELDKLLFRAGFTPCQWNLIPGSGYDDWNESGRRGTVRIGNLRIEGLSTADAEEFFVYQHLVRAGRRALPDYGLTSIIIVTFNQLSMTRQCVDSVLSRTDVPVELIFVDNGSSDGTPDYLETIPGARVIRNVDNRGFARGVNQGIRVASGDQIVLLNNDCIVTTGWLEGLLDVLHDNPQNGLVGPVSNSVSGGQQIPVSYRDLTGLDGFAWQRRESRVLTLTNRLVGFCLLFRRDVLDRIGELDEQFEIGCFEDDDFCRRAINAGFRAVIAHHVFVHHFGSATFRGAGLNLGDILKRNGQRFEQKWAAADKDHAAAGQLPNPQHDCLRPAGDPTRYTSMRLPNGERLLQRKELRLSLCMIVRDNEDTIEACLDSIYPWVDEIIIVDTGSTDRTPEICRSFGARMFEFPWCDDFSAARNESLKHARGEWIFWMDSDDIIPEEQGRQLRSLVFGDHAVDCLGYVIQVHCLSDEPGQMTIVDHVKVFRNLPELRFEHRIHEQILPAIRRIGGMVAFTDIHVLHSGSRQTPETRQRKLERDFRILKLDLAERPDHPFILFNLGMTYEDAGDYSTAETYLRRSIDVASPGESHLRKAWALLVNCHSRSGSTDSAISLAGSALEQFSDDKELLFRRAVLLQHAGRFTEAAKDYRRILSEDVDRVFMSLDPAITGFKLHYNLAFVLDQLGEHDQAIRHWKLAIADSPLFSPAWLSIGRTLAAQNCGGELSELQAEIPDDDSLAATRAIISAFLASLRNDMLAVQRILSAAWNETRQSECLDELCRLLTEKGQHSNAIPYLRELASVRPDELAVLRNLGLTLQICGRLDESQLVLTRCRRLMTDGNQNS